MALPKALRISGSEYLARERLSDSKHELWDGRLFAMSGARLAHVRIVGNIVRRFLEALEGSSCEILSNDTRVSPDNLTQYFYPDAAIACQDAEFVDDQLDTLLNPIAIFEVPSESTAAVDKDFKFVCYRQIRSLRHYILIDSRSMLVEHYQRTEVETWLVRFLREPDDVLELSDLAVRVPVRQIYDRVDFAREANA